MKEKNGSKIFSPSEINSSISDLFSKEFNAIYIQGEVTNLSKASSGHVYFSLKDSASIISAVCFASAGANVKNQILEGALLVCFGSLKTYNSKYQIIVQKIEIVSNLGQLAIAFEALKQKFLKEGIFAVEHKKSIGAIPMRIGIITSLTGAVIKDMLHRINDRMPLCVIVANISVQGPSAASECINAIDSFEKLNTHLTKKIDFIIIARGGGSIEELFAFNNEALVYKIFNSNIAIVSAIGHEIDFTLCDFVADRRAPTPSAAIEMCIPIKSELYSVINNTIALISIKMKQKIEMLTHKLAFINERISIQSIINRMDQKFNLMCNQLEKMRFLIEQKLQRLSFNLLDNKFEQFVERKLELSIGFVKNFALILEKYDHRAILKKGYNICRSSNGYIIKSIMNIQNNTLYELEMIDGRVQILSTRQE